AWLREHQLELHRDRPDLRGDVLVDRARKRLGEYGASVLVEYLHGRGQIGLSLDVITTEANRGKVEPTWPPRGEDRGGSLSFVVIGKGNPHDAELQGQNIITACYGRCCSCGSIRDGDLE